MNLITKENYLTLVILLFTAFMLVFPDIVFAQTAPAPTEANFLDFIYKIVNLLTSGIATGIGTLMLILFGFAWMMGIFNKGWGLGIIGGLVIIYSAAWIIHSVSPSP